MTPFPISLMFMTSTKGHFGHRDIWLATLNDLFRQIPAAAFAAKVAHIKVTPSEEDIATNMGTELERRGFKVIKTVADWSRGTSHQVAYNQDLIKVSQAPELHRNPYVLWLEDDSTLTPVSDPLDKVLSRMIDVLQSSPEIASIRFIREADFRSGVPVLKREGDVFYSPYFDFQPALLRSRDFFLAAKTIEANPDAQAQVQIEMLWRLVLNGFSRTELRHVVWHPDYAHSIHLGTPEYPALKQSLNL